MTGQPSIKYPAGTIMHQYSVRHIKRHAMGAPLPQGAQDAPTLALISLPQQPLPSDVIRTLIDAQLIHRHVNVSRIFVAQDVQDLIVYFQSVPAYRLALVTPIPSIPSILETLI